MANTKVVIDLEVTDKGLVATFNKTTKALVSLNAAQKEKLNLQKKLKTAGTKYLASQEEESKQIVRINKETAENNRISGISVKRKIDNKKAMEQAAYWASKEGIEYKKNILLMREAAKQAELTAIKQIQSSKKTVSEGVANSAMGLDQMKTTAGLSGAIVTEMGRTISDAPYGLKGMGNNISQLSSLFGMFAVNVKKSGRTMTQGFKQLGASLMGPIGFVTGLQLVVALIQSGAFEKLLDFFTSAKDKASDFKNEISKLTESVRVSQLLASKYVETLNKNNVTEEERITLIKELKKIVPSLKDEDFKYGNNLEKVTAKINSYALSQASRIEIDKLSEKNQVALAKKAEILNIKSIEDEEERNRRIKQLLHEQVGFFDNAYEETANINSLRIKALQEGLDRDFFLPESLKGQEFSLADVINKTSDMLLNDLSDLEKEIDEKASPVLKRIQELIFDTESGGTNTPTPLDKKIFEAKLLDLAKLTEKFRQEAESAEEITREEAIKREAGFAKAELEIRRQSFVDKEKARLKEFQKGKDLSQEQIDTIESQAKAETDLVIAQIDIRTQAQLAALKIITDAEEEEVRKRFNNQLSLNAENNDAYNAQRKTQLFNGAVTEQIMQAEVDTVNYENKKAQLERALDDTKENTAARSRIQGQMVLLDKQRGDQVVDNDQKVQDAKLKLANRGAAVLADILGKETKAGKAVAATMATINTYQAVSNALKTGVAPFKYIDAGITAAQGFMQVKNILNTTGPKTSGGGTSAPAVQPPDFNIIGSTGTNQLAEAIGSTTQEPVRAYVVSSEVTSAQELDRNIEESASI